jgi:hypothetical protein
MAFKFYLDGQLTDSPVNEFDLSTTIDRDNETEGILITQDVQLQYNGNNVLNPGEVSGYTVLLDAFDTGTCNELLIDIYDEVSDTLTLHVYQGVIKVPSIEVDLHRMIISTKVQDNSFYAYLSNNQSIDYNFVSPSSKNGVAITPAVQTDVNFFNPIDCQYNSLKLRKGVNINDAFDFIVRALSDNKVSFYSFSLQQEPVLFLFTGHALTLANSGDDSELITSFEQMMSELKKVRNVGYYIDRTNLDNPVLIIEDLDMIYGGNNFFEFTDIKELTATVNTDDIYASIKVGSKRLADGANPNYTFPESISYLGFREEVYVPLGQCNFDNELDLVNDYIISSNMISDQLYGALTENLEDVFMVECENYLGNWRAVQYPSWVGVGFGVGTCFYNKGLSNPTKLNVQNSNYQSATTNTLSTGTYGFRAEQGAEQISGSFDPGSGAYIGPVYGGFDTQPVIFVDETSGPNYDGSGNYNNVTGVYVAPVDGDYSFSSTIDFRIVGCDTCVGGVNLVVLSSPSSGLPVGTYAVGTTKQQFNATLTIQVYSDNTLTVLLNQSSSFATFAGDGTYSLSNNFVGYLATGNAVIVSLNVDGGVYCYNLTNGIYNFSLPNPNIRLLNASGWVLQLQFSTCSFPLPYPTCYSKATSYFECNGMPDGVLTFGSSDPKLFRSKAYEFEYHIDVTDFEVIKNNPTGLYKFEKDNIERFGWLDNMKRNDWTGMTTVKLITNNAATPK